MITLKEGLLNKNNIKDFNKNNYKAYFVWPVMDDFGYINEHPHWIEMTLHDIKGNQAGRVYIFNKDQLLKDVRHFKEDKTVIFVSNVRQDELIQRLEKYRVSSGSSSTEVLSNEEWVKAYSLQQFKNEYRKEI